MKFCVSTGVGTWTNWSTFEPDPDHSPDAGTGKFESRRSVEGSLSNRHLTTGHVMHCREITFTPHCSPRAREFPRSVDFSVRRTVAELRGVKLAQFSDFGLCRRYMRSTECPSSYFCCSFCSVLSIILWRINMYIYIVPVTYNGGLDPLVANDFNFI